MKTYEEAEYAANRLNETMVMLNGRAFFVNHIDIEEAVVTGIVYEPMAKRAHCQLHELDITPVQLGYVNDDVACTYLVRAPMREDWRQGLRHNSMRTSDGRRADHISWNSIAATVENKFPSIKEAIQQVADRMLVAFSRSFAISNQGGVFYKDMFVGNIDLFTGTITLLPKFEWLNETLEEERH